MKILPATGTVAFLEAISPHIPDDLIDSLFEHRYIRGRPQSFSPSQLFRVSLLPLLTPARSYNLIVKLLGEQQGLRSFARLPNRMLVPDVRMLHEFPSRMDLAKLRRLNVHLLRPLLDGAGKFAKTVALIDSTDVPAATNGYKKTRWANTSPIEPTWGRAAAKTVRAVITSVTKSTPCDVGFASIRFRFTGSASLMGRARQSGRLCISGTKHSLLCTTTGMDSGYSGRRHVLCRPASPAPAL